MILPIRNIAYIALLIVFLPACSKSDDQRRYEDEAFVEPRGITRTDASGAIQSGEEDPGDWLISPMYQGLISVQPAYPNPADFNSYIYLDVSISFPDAVEALQISSFRFPYQLNPTGIVYDQSNLYSPITIAIPAQSIAVDSESLPDLEYRILVFDGNDNLITYGDVRIN